MSRSQACLFLLTIALASAWICEPCRAQAPAKKGPAATTPATPKAVAKYETPAACYAAMVEAGKGKDPAAILPCFSEAMQNHLLGNMAFNLERFGALSDGGEAAAASQKVLKKHGLYGKDLMGFLQVVDSPVGGGAGLGFIQIGDSIKDKRAFFAEGSAALTAAQKLLEEVRAKEAGDAAKEAKPAEAEKAPETKLVDVKVTGETASGKITVVGVEESQPVFFKRENGSWVMMMGEKEPDWKQPIQGRFRFSDYLKQIPE
jgi:hypothetical protein